VAAATATIAAAAAIAAAKVAAAAIAAAIAAALHGEGRALKARAGRINERGDALVLVLPRHAFGRGAAHVRGRRAPIVWQQARVCLHRRQGRRRGGGGRRGNVGLTALVNLRVALVLLGHGLLGEDATRLEAGHSSHDHRCVLGHQVRLLAVVLVGLRVANVEVKALPIVELLHLDDADLEVRNGDKVAIKGDRVKVPRRLEAEVHRRGHGRATGRATGALRLEPGRHSKKEAEGTRSAQGWRANHS